MAAQDSFIDTLCRKNKKQLETNTCVKFIPTYIEFLKRYTDSLRCHGLIFCITFFKGFWPYTLLYNTSFEYHVVFLPMYLARNNATQFEI